MELPALNITAGAIGVLIAVTTGISALFKFEEKWTLYRTISESLKHERFLYFTEAEPYKGDDSFPLLVRRVESLITQENRDWSE